MAKRKKKNKCTGSDCLNFIEEDAIFCDDCIDALAISKQDHIRIISKAEIVDFDPEDDDSINSAFAGMKIDNKQEDLMYVKFKLVHADINKNKDEFKVEELKPARRTPILKLVNWQHKEPSIGAIYKSEYAVGSDGEKDYLDCLAAISKYKYKDYAKIIAERHAAGNLFFSMETYFKEAECSICHELFANSEDYCEHLKTRFEPESKASRILRGLTFAGAGVVDNPADVLAGSLALASSNHEEEQTVDNDKTVNASETPEVPDTNSMLAEKEVVINDLTSKLAEATNQVTETVAKFNDLSAQFEAATIKITELTAELNDLKADVESNAQAHARIKELKGIGYSIPEDDESFAELFSKIRNLNDDAYSILKDFVSQTKPSTEANEQVDASESEDESNDIPVTAQAETGSNAKYAGIKSVIANVLSCS
jgi:hypothetical protein